MRPDMEGIRHMPILTLAYIGDAVFELWLRTYLVKMGTMRVGDLHKAAVGYAQAKGQSALAVLLLPELEELERAVFYRGRNAKGQCPRHADVLDYRRATGLEALIGYLYMSDQQERLEVIFTKMEGLIRDNAAEVHDS